MTNPIEELAALPRAKGGKYMFAIVQTNEAGEVINDGAIGWYGFTGADGRNNVNGLNFTVIDGVIAAVKEVAIAAGAVSEGIRTKKV